MDWEKIDLTLEGHVGGDEHPNIPWHMRADRLQPDIYLDLFGVTRDGSLRLILDDIELRPRQTEDDNAFDIESAANNFMGIFGCFPAWLKADHPWLNGAMAGGDCCDMCMTQMNLLNSSLPGCCDQCERELNERLSINPNVVFAFGPGGLQAVA